MSDTEDTAGSDVDDVLEFRCRKCPGKTFTAAEKDSHRQFHRTQKEKEGKKRPGPKSKTLRASSRNRDRSPDPSEATLFEAMPVPAAAPKPAKRPRTAKGGKEAKKKKITSKKHYNDDVIGSWANGTGA